MNVNVNDISGFDAMTEEVRCVYIERDRLRDEVEALLQFKKDICEVLGVGGNSHNDGVVKVLKAVKSRANMEADNARMYGDILDDLKKYFKMTAPHWKYSDIPHFIKTSHEFALEKKEDAEEYAQTASDNLEKICSALGIECSTDTTLEYILDTIDDLKARSLEFNLRKENFKKLCDILGREPNHTTWLDIYDEIEKLRSWKEVAADHDRRRKNWVRKYKSEHERANSCDELYKKYKALYDADAPKREKLSDDIQTYRSSYEAIKNVATKNRSLMNTVANIVGTVGMHDDVTLTGVLNARKKANHWDILVEGYGEGTIRSLLDNIGIDVSGDKGNGLFK